jgi:hypothetical protein
MELEGLRARAAHDPARIEMRARDQRHPLISKYFPCGHAGPQMIPRNTGARASRTTRAGGPSPNVPRGAARGRVLPRSDAASRCCAATPATTARSSRASSRAITTSRSTRRRATACWCRSTSTTRAAHGPSHQGAGGHVARDRQAPRRRRRAGAARSRRA